MMFKNKQNKIIGLDEIADLEYNKLNFFKEYCIENDIILHKLNEDKIKELNNKIKKNFIDNYQYYKIFDKYNYSIVYNKESNIDYFNFLVSNILIKGEGFQSIPRMINNNCMIWSWPRINEEIITSFINEEWKEYNGKLEECLINYSIVITHNDGLIIYVNSKYIINK